MRSHFQFFLVACAFEAALGALALGVNALLGNPLAGDLALSPTPVLQGALGAIPVFAFFVWSLDTSWPPFRATQQLLEDVVRRHFQNWTILQLLVVSGLAGLGEELLFRSAIQANLISPLGVIVAVGLTSVLFAVCHAMNRAYFVVTLVMSVYLGILHIVTQNLIAPVVTHALYDFLALVYFLRFHRPSNP